MAEVDKSKMVILSGYVALVTALVTITLGSASVQALGGAVPDFQLTVCRCLAQTLTFGLITKYNGLTLHVDQKDVGAVSYNGFLYVLYNTGFYGSTVYLPLMEAFAVFVIIAMLVALIHGRIVFGREVQVSKVCSVAIMVCAIVFLVQPCWIFTKESYFRNLDPCNITAAEKSRVIYRPKNDNQTPKRIYTENSKTKIHREAAWGYILATFAGYGCAGYYDVIAIPLRHLKPEVKVTQVSILGTVAATLFCLYFEDPVFSLEPMEFGLVLAHCSTAVVSAFVIAYSAHVLGGVTCTMGRSLQILVMMLFQYTLMSTVMPGIKNWIEVVGVLMLIGGMMLGSMFEFLQKCNDSNTLP